MAEVFDIRPYKELPYLVFPNGEPTFKIRVGQLMPSVTAFVYQRDNLFGDALPLELAGLFIKFNLYNNDSKLIAQGDAFVIDSDRALIEYAWNQFDIREPGTYYGEFVFTDLDDKVFTLPDGGAKFQIIAF